MFAIAKLVATYLYVGLLPKMPGTWGSIFALPLAWFLYQWGITTYLVGLATVTLLGIWASEIYSKSVGNEDPDEVVIDEVAGILTVFLFIKPTPLSWVLGLILFRVVDILKPPPINWVEKIPYGVGIMADDLLAGVLVGVILFAVERIFGFG
ncbi:MAG TPA: phosphatidylglycerophosphatase A [Aquifex aeolicus]|uniref:Phosphatidylglycerophosphatase A n=1 Tax=Aquifex aeolicus TaxID=63363 RepID=A0A9D0YPQ9_AQUAO|nr:phosphatidylglycerophosphatase A [Aquificales bacterium]HIP98622.1 phosphatidylglycerophosphatase A [Aquifex aeolicus]HIQ26444.1 phosphatidylglycerophosphatase A [Aquifex aeolicus]